jgi:HK97 family phage portal protein
MSFFSRLTGYFGKFNAIADSTGTQNPAPGTTLVPDTANVGVDGSLQLSTVWGCIDRRATTIASLPFFAYESTDGKRTLSRTSRLYQLLHESPNSRMTPFEFWRAMMLNYDLRGNAYARLERDTRGEVFAMWPMAADQVEVKVLDDGSMVYSYYIQGNVAVLSADNVLHLKNLGNGTTGLAKLDYMHPAIDEAAKAQTAANKVFGSGGKPTGILMIDKVLNPEQRKALKQSFGELAEGSTSRLQILEANMKYEQISISPEDQQLLETRKFSVEELCRWFDVPPVLVHHSNVTAWGTGIEQIVDGFHKFTIRPMLVNIEQAVRKRVLSPRQRAIHSIEFALDALLRGSLKDRMEIYSKAVQNGIKTRNECRQLENDTPITGGDELTAQSNLVPLALLGKVKGATNGSTVSTQDTIAN